MIYRCYVCRKSCLYTTIDHVVPLFLGGDNSDDNLETICVKCNSEKEKIEGDIQRLFSKHEEKYLRKNGKI